MIERMAASAIRESLEDTPVVLIHGPRQTGKSTLAQSIGAEIGADYVTLDDPVPRSLAATDPTSLIAGRKKTLIIDEVQRAPELFLSLKSAVDRDRSPGKFLLTGSANVLALPKIADSLAGRIAIIDLQPLSQFEVESGKTNFIDEVFEDSPQFTANENNSVIERMSKGGFPEPYFRSKPQRREAWFADYVRTLLERDVRDLANIEGLAHMPRLLKLLAARCGTVLNVADVSAESRIPNTSLHRYLDLLQALFLTFQLPAWSHDQTTRLAKTPKTFLVDTGLACYLRDANQSQLERDPDLAFSLLKNFIAGELRKLAMFSEVKPNLFHLRTVKRLEVDFVVERRNGNLVGINVASTPHILPEHLESLEFLRELANDRFMKGIVFYFGDEVQQLSEKVFALPFSSLWT